jgi:hypothetical protein
MATNLTKKISLHIIRLNFTNLLHKSNDMSVYDEFTPACLVQTILYKCAEINGNRKPLTVSEAPESKKAIADCMAVLARRVKQDPTLKEEEPVKSFVQAIQDLDNVFNVSEVAEAVKSLPWKENGNSAAVQGPRYNPFR